jgi:peroxiredoxin
MSLRFLIPILAAAAVLLWAGCLQRSGNTFEGLAPGLWRGVLVLRDKELPFHFRMFNTDRPGQPVYAEFYNGEEVIRVDSVVFRRGSSDTVRFFFPLYDSCLEGVYDSDQIADGRFWMTTKPDFSLTFRAKLDQAKRFVPAPKTPWQPRFDLSGRWSVTFFSEDSTEYPSVAEFKQRPDGTLLGTFLTTTGDYRFLEGAVFDNKLYLSCFDGSHAFYFEATAASADQLINGGFLYGNGPGETWEARRDPNAALPDALSLTKLRPGAERMAFSFPNELGQTISLSDPLYQGKVKLVQVMGTWCPNCGDEGAFLGAFHEAYRSRGVEVVGLAFEKHRDPAKAAAAIARFKQRYGIRYEILHAGANPKKEAVQALPWLESLNAYPTLFFVDKNDRIRYVHQGFSGPATSEYAVWEKETTAKIEALLAE